MVVRCPNCGGPLQKFRKLSKAEQDYVAQTKQVSDPGAYQRCTGNDGACRRFQRWSNWRDGGDFPV
ncbi:MULTISPECIES: hypothetical protein [unclassified Streptomyces]|uniref:hypothetical protein n=1 Tax=unclassified Streptomyces TaxID=2593676 RepID=UPI001661D1C0|nr:MULTISPECIES: hypothetical protein [unclassified Streptomyces]MBD0837686.1 hypothetical protein [Streptomyces sp. TRM68416]